MGFSIKQISFIIFVSNVVHATKCLPKPGESYLKTKENQKVINGRSVKTFDSTSFLECAFKALNHQNVDFVNYIEGTCDLLEVNGAPQITPAPGWTSYGVTPKSKPKMKISFNVSPQHDDDDASLYRSDTCTNGGPCGTGVDQYPNIRINFATQYIKRLALTPAAVPMTNIVVNVRLEDMGNVFTLYLPTFNLTQCGEKDIIVGQETRSLRISGGLEGWNTPDGQRLLFNSISVFSD